MGRSPNGSTSDPPVEDEATRESLSDDVAPSSLQTAYAVAPYTATPFVSIMNHESDSENDRRGQAIVA
jgi:hypothetical protein